nr:MAG: hypothetical protein [Microvirus sp.]
MPTHGTTLRNDREVSNNRNPHRFLHPHYTSLTTSGRKSGKGSPAQQHPGQLSAAKHALRCVTGQETLPHYKNHTKPKVVLWKTIKRKGRTYPILDVYVRTDPAQSKKHQN